MKVLSNVDDNQELEIVARSLNSLSAVHRRQFNLKFPRPEYYRGLNPYL
ncbi:hypothetical protein [Coleofasciculus sp. B1-GNL1-01]